MFKEIIVTTPTHGYNQVNEDNQAMYNRNKTEQVLLVIK